MPAHPETALGALRDCGAVGIAFWNADGRIVDANEAFLALAGRSRAELAAGELAWGAPHPEGSGAFQAQLVRPDGGLVQVLVHPCPLDEDPGRAVGMGVVVDVTAAVGAQQRLAELHGFIEEASLAFSDTLDVASVCNRIARAAVSRLSDGCHIVLADPDGTTRLSVSHHSDPEKAVRMRQYARRGDTGLDNPNSPATAVFRAGRSLLVADVDEAALAAALAGARNEPMPEDLLPRSLMVAPLVARGRTIGVITLALTERGRRFDQQDLALVEHFAGWAALAIDNARLFGEAVAAQAQAEEQAAQLADQAVELETANVDLQDALQAAEDARDAAEATARRYRLLFEQNPLPMWIYDRETLGFLAVNEAAVLHYGYTRREFLRMTIADIRPPEDAARLRAAVADGENVLRRQSGWRHVRKDGSTIDVEIVSAPIEFDGRPGKLVLAHDVSARVRTEAQLRESAELLHATVDESPLAIVGYDLDLLVTRWNRAAERLFGWSAEEIVGRSYLAIVPEAQREQFQRLRERVLAGEAVTSVETVRGHRDGTALDVHVSLAALRDPAGTPQGFVTILADIGERRRLEMQLRQSQKLEAIGRLAGGVAHDFNNILTIITSYAALVLADPRLDAERREDVEKIEAASERAADLTRQLLAFSRQRVLQPEVVDVNAVVMDVERMTARLIGEDISVVTKLAPKLDRVLVDVGQLHQVLLNLAVNARDAMPAGGKLVMETANIEIDEAAAAQLKAPHAGHFVVLTVSDTGIGMDEETRSRIFDPFFTTKPAGKGTGIGLSTVYGIVQQSGGSVTVYSEPRLGTTFRIYLPRHEASSVEPAAVAAPRPAALQRGGVVLLVEDDPGVRKLTHLVLTRLGYTVMDAEHGARAVELLEQYPERIDLVVSDMVMPELGGRSVAAAVAALRPDTRVLLMSGYSEEMIGSPSPVSARVGFLEKPFTPTSLAAAIDALLAG